MVTIIVVCLFIVTAVMLAISIPGFAEIARERREWHHELSPRSFLPDDYAENNSDDFYYPGPKD